MTGKALTPSISSPPQNIAASLAEPAPIRGLKASQKAALIVAALGPEAAGPIIEKIGDTHLRAFARAYAQLETVPKSVLTNVAQEFVSCLSTDENNIKGGFDETRSLLGQFISSDQIVRLMDDIDVPGGQTIWEKLERTSDEALAEYLAGQNLQMVAIVLSKLTTEKASSVLGLLETETAQAVVVRLSKPLQARREALAVLSTRIEREFLAPLRDSSNARNPGEMIGAMMNNIASEKRDQLLSFITSEIPEIMGDLRKSMLTFQELSTRVPPNAAPIVIKELEPDIFLKAVKFGRQNAPSSVDFIFKNISQRMAKQYEEQLEAITNVPVNEGEGAQAEFMKTVRRLVKSGEIDLIDIVAEEEAA